jgi:hypothetical protein
MTYKICVNQIYLVSIFLWVKYRTINDSSFFSELKKKLSFNLLSAYKNDDDFNQKVPTDEFEKDVFMAINFFRKYPKNIFLLKKAVGYTKQVPDQDELEKEFKQKYQYQLQHLELSPYASSACRKIINQVPD